jgi:hypothetical protein
MGLRFLASFTAAVACFLVFSCDGGKDGCITRKELAESDCIAPDLFLPPGLCEPLECVSETMEFTLPPGDPEQCVNPETCDILLCRDSRDVYTNLRINEDGNVEGTVIINVDVASEPFVCD